MMGKHVEESMDNEMESGLCGGSNKARNANVVTFTTGIPKKGSDLCSLCHLDLHRFLCRYLGPNPVLGSLDP